MRTRSLALGLITLLAMSCADPAAQRSTDTATDTSTSYPPATTTVPTIDAPLDRALAQWRRIRQPDYVFVLNRGCTVCDQQLVGSFRITVRNGSVAMVERIPTEEIVAPGNAPTMDELLALVAEHLHDHPDAEATFDADLGIPLLAELGDEDSIVVDFFQFDLSELRSELQDARQRWEENGWSDYTITWERRCFCEPAEIGPFQTSVSAGEIVASSSTGSPDTDVSGQPSASVETLFDTIEQHLDMHPAKLTVAYDSEMGFPHRMFADIDSMMADEEYGFEVSAISPTSGP